MTFESRERFPWDDISQKDPTDPTFQAHLDNVLGVERVEPLQGLRVLFTNPEVLRAYILDPERPKGVTPEQRMAKVTGREIAGFDLPDGVFSSVSVRLLTEENPMGNPTAIIRTDFTLRDTPSHLRKFQAIKKDDHLAEDDDVMARVVEILNRHDADFSHGKYGSDWDANTLLFTNRTDDDDEAEYISKHGPMVAVQLWEPDNHAATISISLFSAPRLSQARKEKMSHFSNDEREVSSWQFPFPVGISTRKTADFAEAVAFYEHAMPILTGALYRLEGQAIPETVLEIEPPIVFKGESDMTFDDVGGLDRVVTVLKAKVHEEKYGERDSETHPHILINGPAGTGKTSLIHATAHALEAPVIEVNSKVLADAHVQSIGLLDFLKAKFFEARSQAYQANGKAILALENVEGIFGSAGYLAEEEFSHLLDDWTDDDQVLVMATSVEPSRVSQQVTSRFHNLQTVQPTISELMSIMEKQMERFVRVRGRDDLFGEIDTRKVVTALPKAVGRDIVQLLGQSIAIARLQQRESGTWKPISTDLVYGLRPPQRHLGF